MFLVSALERLGGVEVAGLLISDRARSTKDVRKKRRMVASGKSEASGLVMMRAVNVKVLSS